MPERTATKAVSYTTPRDTISSIERAMSHFSFERMLDRDIAISAAGNYRSLRRLGYTIRTSVDVIVGTFCIKRGHQLLHDDRDFGPMVKHLGLQLA